MKSAKFMNNKWLLLQATRKQPQEKVLQMSLKGERLKIHFPEATAKLKGVWSEVPWNTSMEDVKKKIWRGKIIDSVWSVWAFWRTKSTCKCILRINWTGLRTLKLSKRRARAASIFCGGWCLSTSAGKWWGCFMSLWCTVLSCLLLCARAAS